MEHNEYVAFEELLGKTLTQVNVFDDPSIGDGDEIIFISNDGSRYKMYHNQDCCESVYIDDICGNLEDLIGTPILLAEEVSEDNHDTDERDDNSKTWTFYKLSTIKGSVTIRWIGQSNGHYSESVNFVEVIGENDAV